MITPSKLNPIKFFAQDEPVYWDTNEYGADRGGYVKPVLNYNDYLCFFDAPAQPLVEVIRCSDNVVMGSLPIDNVSGTTWQVTAKEFSNTEGINYFIRVKEVATSTIISDAGGVNIATINSTSEVGGSFIAPTSFVWDNLTIKVRIGVTPSLTSFLTLYLFNEDTSIHSQQTLNWNLSALAPGDHDISYPIISSFNSIFHNITKGKRFGLSLRTQATDTFEAIYRRGDPDNWSEAWITSDLRALALGRLGTVTGNLTSFSEQIRVTARVFERNQLSEFKYKNVKAFAGVPANTEIVNYLPINFWQTKINQEQEDIEIYPGQFTRLRNETVKATMMETDYLPPYTHEYIAMMLGVDQVIINGIEQIQREAYMFDYTNRHYQLTKGKVTLTEKKSIFRNVI